jgi:hypothetical protein
MQSSIHNWKRFLARQEGIAWQRDFFDHRLRHDESLTEKWNYIRENPLRKGLSATPDDWPYQWTSGRDGSPSRPSSENPTTTLLYWHLGRRLLSENLQESRAEYGKQILATMSRELTTEFGRGFGYATINRAIQLSQCFPDQEIVSTLSTQLSWSHFMELLTPIDALPLQQIK